MKKIFFVISIFLATASVAQKSDDLKAYEEKIDANIQDAIESNYLNVKPYFDEAYSQYPQITKGILEAVSFTMTRFHHMDSTGEESCMGIPRVYGVMGLTLNGKNYFRNNLIKVSELSGISVNDIISSPKENIKAFAAAYVAIKRQLRITSMKAEDQVPVLVELSELPLNGDIKNNFALNSHLYSVLTFLNDSYYANLCNFTKYSIDLKTVFGENNYQVLSSKRITITDSTVTNADKKKFINNHIKSSLNPKSSDYAPAIWNAAASCNYTVGRGGTAISAVVIHDTEGSYAGSIAWFQNCSAVASAHYVLRSSDGQVTQMVLEADKAWHVGSENSYTIGIEHEGYQDQTGWYTTAMYTSSADLSRDICNSGYGISPLRTGFWPWLASTYYNVSGIPGSCTKIKGHQHYPNQTHTDPGPNWDWDYYYKLINNNPTITTLTAASGSFYDTGGSSGNYSNDERDVWVISPTGATSVTLNFSSFSVENTWDYMYIYDGNSVWSPLIGYYTGTTSPGTVTSTGGALTVEFRSDCATNDVGWAATWTSTQATVAPTNLTAGTPSCPDNSVTFSWQNSGTGWYILLSNSSSYTNPYIKWVSGLTTYTGPAGFVLQSDGVTPLTFSPSTTYYWKIWNGSVFTSGPSFTTLNCDNVIPTTAITTPGNWKTQDFTASFSDSDNVNVEKSFYQVLDFDGQYWGANTSHGFFGDNFDIMQPNWINYAGTWAVSNGELVQSDETQNNSNIYAPLNQTLSNRYLYNFIAKLGGSGTNKRFGFHFFCDAGNYANRHNSYFVWFRIDDQSLQFYKVVNDTFTLKQTVSNVTTNLNQSYDFKITYDRITGRIALWRDNVFMGSWTDSSPYSTNGNYISFRTGNCTMNITELKVYRSRYPTVTVTLGDSTKDIRYQNPNPATPSAKIKSIVVDENNNLSQIVSQNLNVDWTIPQLSTVNDGSSADVDTVYDNTTVSVNWQAGVDANSGIQEYFYALGTTAGNDDVVTWTSAGTNISATLTGLNLTYGNKYYFSVKATNNAGLTSAVVFSDGFIVSSLNLPLANFYAVEDTLYVPNTTALFVNQSQNAITYLWNFGDGDTSTQVNPWHTYAQTGVYAIQLIAMNPPLPNDTLLRNNYIYVIDNSQIAGQNYVNQMYPNPFSDNIHIVFANPFTGTIEMTDILGKTIVKKSYVNESHVNLNSLQRLEKGAYTIKIINSNGEVITKSVMIK